VGCGLGSQGMGMGVDKNSKYLWGLRLEAGYWISGWLAGLAGCIIPGIQVVSA